MELEVAMSVTPQSETAPSEAQQDHLGPINVVVLAYPPGAPMTGEAVPMLLDLVDRGTIRVFDAMFVSKADDGSVIGFDARNLGDKDVGDFAVFEGASSGLLGDADVAQAADALEPGHSAAVIVYENRWAVPFIDAVHRNGGEVIDSQRISVQELVEALDATEAAS
jgi:hypothetical protein